MITMEEIARRAGVSRSTASFVLNKRETGVRISESTRERVLAVAREMGYRRNELARAISTGRNFVLGYLRSVACEQESRILDGLLKEATEAGYLVKLLPGVGQSAAEVSRLCVEQRLAGLIVRRFAPGHISALLNELESDGIPLVFVDDNPVAAGTGYVTSDDRQGYELAIEHLVRLGHRRIAYIAGDADVSQGQLRKSCFREVTGRYSLTIPEKWIVDSNWDVARGEELTRQMFMQSGDAPTALFCDGDRLAAVAIRAVRSLNLQVPQDVSVIGYGNFSFATLFDPPLTTISQPFEGMGEMAVRYLLQRIETPDEQESLRSHLLSTRLIFGQSTGPAPARQR